VRRARFLFAALAIAATVMAGSSDPDGWGGGPSGTIAGPGAGSQPAPAAHLPAGRRWPEAIMPAGRRWPEALSPNGRRWPEAALPAGRRWPEAAVPGGRRWPEA